MSICVCNISALEMFRASGRLLPGMFAQPHTSKLHDCGLAPYHVIKDDLSLLGVREIPVHLLVGTDTAWHASQDIVCHKHTVDLPAKSLIKVRRGIYVTSPELTFLDLAARQDIELVELAMIGYELCGSYVFDTSWDGLTMTDTPMTTVPKISHAASVMRGQRGSGRAQQAIDLVLDGSRSPMESILAALLTFPRRLGGLGLRDARLNFKVPTQAGTKYVDIAFPTYGIGLEYQGRQYHSLEQVQRDDRRKNSLIGTGLSIFDVWYEDLVDRHLFDALVSNIVHAMGIRLRIRSNTFTVRQELLRAALIPAVKRFGDRPREELFTRSPSRSR